MDSNLPNNQNINTPVDAAPAVKRQKSKAPILAATLCGVLAVAGIGFGVYAFLDSNKKGSEIADLKAEIASLKVSTKDSTDDKTADKTTDEPADEPEEDIFDVKDTEVSSYVAELKKLAKDTVDVMGDDSTEHSFATYFDGLKAATSIEKNYGFTYEPSDIDLDQAGLLSNALINKLTNDGFVSFDDARIYPAGPSYINEDTGIACYVSGGLPFGLSCGYYKWVSDETVELVNELADAYKASEGKYPHYLGVYASEGFRITDSEISPYQTLTARFENAAALFYRVSPNDEWKYFIGTQAVLNCSDYNTEELKNAFAGDVCYDGGMTANGIVQP